MLLSLVYFAVGRLLRLLSPRDCDDAAREIEILVLRHQLCVLSRGRRLPLRRRDRILLAAASRLLPRKMWRSFPVSPQTVLRWHRELVRRKWLGGDPIPDPRPRRQVLGALRRGISLGRSAGHPDADTLSESERLRRTIRENCTAGVFGPHPRLRRTPPRTSPRGVCQTLQQGTTASRFVSRDAGTKVRHKPRRESESPGCQAWWIDQRI
jgi:hypothetical protein